MKRIVLLAVVVMAAMFGSGAQANEVIEGCVAVGPASCTWTASDSTQIGRRGSIVGVGTWRVDLWYDGSCTGPRDQVISSNNIESKIGAYQGAIWAGYCAVAHAFGTGSLVAIGDVASGPPFCDAETGRCVDPEAPVPPEVQALIDDLEDLVDCATTGDPVDCPPLPAEIRDLVDEAEDLLACATGPTPSTCVTLPPEAQDVVDDANALLACLTGTNPSSCAPLPPEAQDAIDAVLDAIDPVEALVACLQGTNPTGCAAVPPEVADAIADAQALVACLGGMNPTGCAAVPPLPPEAQDAVDAAMDAIDSVETLAACLQGGAPASCLPDAGDVDDVVECLSTSPTPAGCSPIPPQVGDAVADAQALLTCLQGGAPASCLPDAGDVDDVVECLSTSPTPATCSPIPPAVNDAVETVEDTAAAPVCPANGPTCVTLIQAPGGKTLQVCTADGCSFVTVNDSNPMSPFVVGNIAVRNGVDCLVEVDTRDTTPIVVRC